MHSHRLTYVAALGLTFTWFAGAGCESTRRTSSNPSKPSVQASNTPVSASTAGESKPATSTTDRKTSATEPGTARNVAAAPVPAQGQDMGVSPASWSSSMSGAEPASMDEANLVKQVVKPAPPMAGPGEVVTADGEVLFVRQKMREGAAGGISEQYCEKQNADGSFVKHGPWARWFENGDPYLAGEFLDGREHGMLFSWHPNGQLRGVGQFVFGDKVGKWIKWDDTGRKRNEWHYENNLRNGPFTEWDENGDIVKNGEYVDDRQNGPWVEVVNGVRTERTWKYGVPQD